MSGRCDVTELLVDQCAHCLHLPELPTGPEPRQHPGLYVDGFATTARYDGTCADCGDPIQPGEPIYRAVGGWVGQCCAEEVS